MYLLFLWTIYTALLLLILLFELESYILTISCARDKLGNSSLDLSLSGVKERTAHTRIVRRRHSRFLFFSDQWVAFSLFFHECAERKRENRTMSIVVSPRARALSLYLFLIRFSARFELWTFRLDRQYTYIFWQLNYTTTILADKF